MYVCVPCVKLSVSFYYYVCISSYFHICVYVC